MVNTVPNSVERLVTDIGIILAGAAPVNCIPALTSGEIFFSTVRRSEAKAVVVYPSSPENSDWALIQEGIVDANLIKDGNVIKTNEEETIEDFTDGSDKSQGYGEIVHEYRSEQAPEMTKAIIISRQTSWQREIVPTVPHFMEFLTSLGEEQEFVERRVVASDIGYYHTTTGTTGMQKIVPRLHSSLLKIAEVTGQMAPCRVPSLFVTIKLGWSSGFPFMFFHFGSICVLIDDLDMADDRVKEKDTNGIEIMGKEREDDSPDQVENGHKKSNKNQTDDTMYDVYWYAINAESVPFAHLSPSQIDGLARANERGRSHGRQPSGKVAFVVTGGLPVKESIVSSALENVCKNIVIYYGMTEAGVLSYNVVSNAENYSEGECGRLYRGVECRITDDAGTVLPAGQTGNIQLKTEAMFQGFLKNVEKTKQAFAPGGWFVTADLGFFKADGTLTLLCRRDDVILHGTVLIYPTAIEAVLRRCPGVQDVVVVPVPDKLKHQNICACVIRARGETYTEEELKKSMDALLAFPRNVEIQTPQHVVFMDSFPLVQNTKTDRKLLAQMATEHICTKHQ